LITFSQNSKSELNLVMSLEGFNCGLLFENSNGLWFSVERSTSSKILVISVDEFYFLIYLIFLYKIGMNICSEF